MISASMWLAKPLIPNNTATQRAARANQAIKSVFWSGVAFEAFWLALGLTAAAAWRLTLTVGRGRMDATF